MICSGIRWPNDTTIPKSYLILIPLSDRNVSQSRHSNSWFCSAYIRTGFPLALNDVTTSNRRILEFWHLLWNKTHTHIEFIGSIIETKASKFDNFITSNYRRWSNILRLFNENWSVPKNSTFNFSGVSELFELKRIQMRWPSTVFNFRLYLNNDLQHCIAVAAFVLVHMNWMVRLWAIALSCVYIWNTNCQFSQTHQHTAHGIAVYDCYNNNINTIHLNWNLCGGRQPNGIPIATRGEFCVHNWCVDAFFSLVFLTYSEWFCYRTFVFLRKGMRNGE